MIVEYRTQKHEGGTGIDLIAISEYEYKGQKYRAESGIHLPDFKRGDRLKEPKKILLDTLTNQINTFKVQN